MIQLTGGDLYVRSLSFNSTDTLFATGSEDNLIRIWDIPICPTPRNSSKPSKDIPKTFTPLEFLDEANRFPGSGDQTLKLWNVTGENVWLQLK